MIIVKPEWVHHYGEPICAVDIHKYRAIFATAGGNANGGAGVLCIWNLEPLLSPEIENDERVPKLLYSVRELGGCVNALRWSEIGVEQPDLATGDADKLVKIWTVSHGKRKDACPTSWFCRCTLRGHVGAVRGVDWSADSKYLASCSADRTVIVWDALNLPCIVAVLHGHEEPVRGVSWDPIGEFLASQSDDRSVRLWSRRDWSCCGAVTQPYTECKGHADIMRPAWSTDGQYLITAHATEQGKSAAAIIERDSWTCDTHFLGYRQPVTCARVHSTLLRRQFKTEPSSDKPPTEAEHAAYCCLAIASEDGALAIWTTALKRPLAVVYELFCARITDLAWGVQQGVLLACSVDGSIAALTFAESELGTRLSASEQEADLLRLYDDNKYVCRAWPQPKSLACRSRRRPKVLPTKASKQQDYKSLEGRLQGRDQAALLLEPPSNIAGETALRLRIENNAVDTAAGELTKVTALSVVSGSRYWQRLIGSTVYKFERCAQFVFLCCANGTLLLLSMRTGLAVWPPLSLAAKVVQCAFCASGMYLGTLVEDGKVRVWHIESQRVLVTTNCSAYMKSCGEVVSFRLTELIDPICVFANSDAYCYSRRLQSWLPLSAGDAITQHCLSASMPAYTREGPPKDHPLLCAQTAFRPRPLLRTKAAYRDQQAREQLGKLVQLPFIENQIKLSVALQTPHELRHWHKMYAYQLAVSGAERGLRALLNDLLGTPTNVDDPKHRVLSINKHQLLRDVLATVKPHKSWASLCCEYETLLTYGRQEYDNTIDDFFKSILEPVPAAACVPRRHEAHRMSLSDN